LPPGRGPATRASFDPCSSLACGDAAYYTGAGRAKQKEIKSRQRRTEDCLCQYFPQDLAVDVGEAAVDAVVADGELGVVNSEQVQDRGVEVVAVDGGLGFPRPLVALAVGDAGFEARAGEPGDEGAAV